MGVFRVRFLGCDLKIQIILLIIKSKHLFMIEIIADCFGKLSRSKSPSTEPVLDIPLVRVPEHLDKPVVHDCLRGVEGHGSLLCAVKCDESRGWVSLKLNLWSKLKTSEINVNCVGGSVAHGILVSAPVPWIGDLGLGLENYDIRGRFFLPGHSEELRND